MSGTSDATGSVVGPLRLAAVLSIAACGGAGTMIVELAAVRLLAPWFGSSLIVWTNVIAVVLLGLALGYLLGGRLSDGPRPLARLGLALSGAALVSCWLPALAGPAARWFLPTGLALHEAADVLAWGSLAASLLLFLVPAALLGTVSPLAVETVQGMLGGRAGRAGGLVLFAGTLGSLVGVFATSHVLLPALGLAGTYRMAALAMGLAGLAALWLGRRTGRASTAAALFVVVGGAGALPFGAARPEAGAAVTVLAAGESSYQSVRAVEDASWDPPLRFLQVNEGFDSFQSAWQPEPGLLPGGFYFNAFALPAWWGGKSGRHRLLVLGLGAGTTFRVLDGASPPDVTWERIGVELDLLVIEMAERFFDLDSAAPDTEVCAGLDARASLLVVDGSFDLVVLDCYANQIEIPPHLATVEFMREIRARLTDDGWLAINVGGFGFDDPVVAAIAQTVAAAFAGPVLVVRIPGARNYIVFARANGNLPVDEQGRVRAVPPEAGADWAAALRLASGSRLVSVPTAGAPLRDGHAPIERLQLRSIAEARARRSRTETDG